MEPTWHSKFPNEPGWYWCYQALPRGNGEQTFPVWVDDSMHLPRDIAAYYGPIEPPTVPEEYVPAIYLKRRKLDEDA